jgi:hypothetical protein
MAVRTVRSWLAQVGSGIYGLGFCMGVGTLESSWLRWVVSSLFSLSCIKTMKTSDLQPIWFRALVQELYCSGHIITAA